MPEDPFNTRKTLLKKIQDQHDNHAWTDFVYYYRKYIYNIARRMNLNHHDSEEVVQSVLLISWKKLPEFDYDNQKGRFRGWLCRVTGNTVKNFFRDQKNRYFLMENEDIDKLQINLQKANLPEIEQLAEEEWLNYLPELAWKNIEDQFEANVKNAFLMSKDGKTTADIARYLGITESSVYVYKKRIKDKLKDEIIRLNQELG